MKKNIIIMDINSHIHRAYHTAIAPYNRDNEKEGAYFEGRPNYMVERAINVIEKEIEEIKEKQNISADYIACVLDHQGKNFRHEMYADYKGNRKPSDQEFDFMRNCIFKLLSLKGYYTIREKGVEADDVIGTLALKSEKAGLNVVIGTDDKDFFQIVSKNINVYRGKIKEMFDVDKVVEKQGVQPNQILDYLAMDGDDADNVIGIPNCGPVTCVKILEKYTLAEVIENPELLTNIKGIKKRDDMITYIKENKDFILLMKEIVKLKDDMDLGLFLKDLVKREEDTPKIINAYSKIGIKKYR